MKVEVCIEGVNDIIREDLTDTIKTLKTDLKRRKAGGTLAIFHMDKEADIAELQKHIDAFGLVLRYYGGA